MSDQLNNIAVLVNNVVVAYTANTLSWIDGLGEYSTRNAVVGGGQTEQIFSEDLSTRNGMAKFSMPTTEDNEKLKREWKVNKNNNVVELIGPSGTTFSKIFTQASILNDPESNASTDGDIEIEFRSNPAQ